MPRDKPQTTYRRGPKGELITETEGKDYDSDSALAVQESQRKALAAMTSGAKPQVSEDEPEKGTVSYMAWQRRQKAKKEGQKRALDSMGSGR